MDFTGKRVGVIGTGATAIQAIPEIAKQAKQLTVFQRRPNWAAPLHNAKISKAEMEAIKSRYDEIYAHCRQTSTWFIHQADPRNDVRRVARGARGVLGKALCRAGVRHLDRQFPRHSDDEKANALISDFVAKKIRQRVKDPEVADKLIPKDHGFGTRRVPLESGYFEAYNRDNVLLVDSSRISRSSASRRKASRRRSEEHEFDILIYATGFDGVTGAFDRIDIRGPDGIRLKDVWADGQPRTYLGMLAERFPQHADGAGAAYRARQHPAGDRALRRIPGGLAAIHAGPRLQARRNAARACRGVDGDRHQGVRSAALRSKIDSWQTGVNRNVDGRIVRRVLGYNGNGVHLPQEDRRNGSQQL